jgi:hypothetical protein
MICFCHSIWTGWIIFSTEKRDTRHSSLADANHNSVIFAIKHMNRSFYFSHIQATLGIRTLHLQKFDFTKNNNLYLFCQQPINFRPYEENGSTSKEAQRRIIYCLLTKLLLCYYF